MEMRSLAPYPTWMWLLASLLLLGAEVVCAAASGTWIATWASSPQSSDAGPSEPLLNLDNQTVRERVRVSVGGGLVRLRLSNEYGSSPLRLDSVTVSRPLDASSVVPDSIQPVTFKHGKSFTIAAGTALLSDPVPFIVESGSEISVSLYFPKRVTTPPIHSLALKETVISRHGDASFAPKLEPSAESHSSILLSAVLVPARPSQRLVVMFGDSLVDGEGSSFEGDQNLTGQLLRRLRDKGQGARIAIVNAGIGGNRLLSSGSGISAGFGASALARFDRDALSLPGVTNIILLEGINDIGFPGAKIGGQFLADPADIKTTEQLIDGYLKLISRAHAVGIKVIGATLSPFQGVDLPGYYSESKEARRQKLNKWIRSGGAFDGVLDVDAVLRDPANPKRLLPKLAYKDHLHPNDAGYRSLADAIDLTLLD